MGTHPEPLLGGEVWGKGEDFGVELTFNPICLRSMSFLHLSFLNLVFGLQMLEAARGDRSGAILEVNATNH